MKNPTYFRLPYGPVHKQLANTLFSNFLLSKLSSLIQGGIVLLMFLCSLNAFAQLPVPFTPRLDGGSIKVKGDIVFIGNSIVTGEGLPQPYNGNQINNNTEGIYINVASGGDPSIFSSSSAELVTDNSCKRIVYAGLYWASVYPLEVATNRSVQFEGTPRFEDWNQIKFKLPTGDFIDLEADRNTDPLGEEDDIIFDGYQYYGPTVEDSFKDSPIICYKNVTNLLQGLSEADGEYTVANLRATRGWRKGGCSAGWTLVVIYESPTLPSKYIALFDGYAGVQNTTELDIPVDGFQTLPAPFPVKANIGVAALEGDIGIRGDSFQFKASSSANYTVLSDAINEPNNFFNSSVTINGVHNINRNPASTNTLGMDINNVAIPNPSNIVLPNDATAGDLKLTTNGDGYGAFAAAFSVEIIEPNIVLTKIVEDEFGNNIGGQTVDLGQDLSYVIGFQNTGNDDATDFIIRDILPVNTILDYPSGLDLPSGVTVRSYDPLTRELIFEIEDSLVEEFDPASEFRINVTVVETCQQLIDACSNLIQNQAFASYRSETNPSFLISDDPSFSANTGCLLSPQTTNFLADLDDCTFSEEVILCGPEVTLTSGSGYDAYTWSTSPTGTPVIGTTQSIVVTQPGTYYVENTAIAPCQSTSQTFEVITFGGNVDNPLIPYADELVTCPNDGKVLPNIYLCGANDSRSILTGITDTTSMIWERLDESSCAAVSNQDCANENASCVWNEVATGPDYLIESAGQYRITLNFDGGCFSQFYFNVYENILDPNATSRDIYCTTPGEISVGGVPSGYEFSIDGSTFQSSPIFPINTAGIYTVYIRQVGVNSSPCVFTIPDIQINSRDFTTSATVTQPLCFGELGNVVLAANDVRPQYFFSISNGGTLVNSVGPIAENNYTFENLNPGTYTYSISTEDGCIFEDSFEIIEPPVLTADAALTTPLGCTDGEITIYAQGGTAPYFYFVNSTTDFQTSPVIVVTASGDYDITVVDSNNCSVSTSISVDEILAPEYTISQTDLDCSGDPVGRISINVSNANGNTLEYSIDNGTTFTNSPVFTNLSAGTYEVIIRYSLNGDFCDTALETITISAPNEITALAELSSNYTCVSDATILVSNVTGGVSPYTYSIDGVNYQSGNSFSGLSAGTYNVFVQDASNCAATVATITIDPLNPPTDMDFSQLPLSCPSNTTSVLIENVVGGIAPFEYQITAPASQATTYQTSNTFSGLEAGTYTFQIRDANSCTYSETYTISPLPELIVSSNLVKSLDCTASPDALISGSISGGVAPYTYAVSFNGGSFTDLGTAGATFSYNAVVDGSYQFQITDSNGCTAETAIQVISPLVAVTTTATSSNPSCNGDTDGTISLVGQGGQAPYLYSIDGGSTFVSSNNFGGLSAGTYNYVVRDSNACEATGTLDLLNPDPIVANFSSNPIQCNSNVLGSIDVAVTSGGISPFTYTIFDSSSSQIGTSVNTSNTTNTFNGLSFGDYKITIVDSNGCELESDIIRIETPPNINLIGNATTGSCATGATVDIEVISGVAPFSYSIFGQPATIFGPTNSTTHTFTNLNHGVTYQFQVIDAGGCFSVIEVTTPVLSAININTTSVGDVSCNGGSDGLFNFTVSDYDPSVTTLYYEVQDPLTNLPISPAVNGTISGLSGAPANGSISGLSSGSYTLLVRENDGTFCTTSTRFEISQPVQPLLSTVSNIENATCNTDAQVTLSTSGGTGPYEYAVGAVGFTPTNADFGSNNVIGLDYSVSSNWDIVVRDANGCELRLNETISIDPEPVISAVANNQCIANEGEFEIEVSLDAPGEGPYTFSVDGGAFQPRSAPFVITNLVSGTHTVQVRDTNGCGNTITIDLNEPLNITPDLTARASCNDNDGIITMTATGGTGAYSYNVSPNPATAVITGNVISGLSSGIYTITATDLNNGCSAMVEILVPEAVLPSITVSPSGVDCFGTDTGSFDLLVNGYTGPYTYEVFDASNTSVFGVQNANTNSNPINVSGLLAGTYQVVLNESNSPFCSATTEVIIISPAEELSLDVIESSNVTCDNNSGTIVATAQGGTGSYEFELSGPVTRAYSSSSSFSNLPAGVYTVSVRDEQGCITSEVITLNEPQPIQATISVANTDLACFGDNSAEITIDAVSGGQGSNFTYTLNSVSPVVSSSGPQTSPVFSNLTQGTYNVLVEDGFNCSFLSADIVISEPTPVLANLVKEVAQTCFTDASLTLSATGGNGPYSYSDSEDFSNILGSFSSSVTIPAGIGEFKYYVQDANGCISVASNSIEVEPLEPLVVNLDTTNSNINCAGDSSGVIVATAQGGLGNYVYTLLDASNNPITTVTQDSPGIFTQLPAGTYSVNVVSGDCEEVSVPVSITEPNAPLQINLEVTNVSCSGNDNGTVLVNATGGTGIIKYAISPRLDQFFDSALFENLEPGDYQIIAQDELGCFQLIDVSITEPEPVVLSIVPNSIIPEVCFGDMDGEFSIEVSGGSLPYSVAIDDIDGNYVTGSANQTIFDFTNLGGGDHIVYVRDNEGCESQWNITFPESVQINPEVLVEYTCDNNSVGNVVTVLVDTTNLDTTDLDYSLNDGPYQVSNIFTNVVAGEGQYIDVRHTNGCIQRTELFSIESYDPVEIRLSNGDINEIIATAAGGTGIYEYTLNGESYGSTSTFYVYESGTYTVTVTDTNGCQASASIAIDYVDICIPNYFTPNGDGVLDGWGPDCANQYQNLEFDIFDRYGRKVASLNVNQKWDGTYEGRELPTGDYWYVVRLNDSNDNRDFVGHFTLYR